jgi:hypothetical protein
LATRFVLRCGVAAGGGLTCTSGSDVCAIAVVDALMRKPSETPATSVRGFHLIETAPVLGRDVYELL